MSRKLKYDPTDHVDKPCRSRRALRAWIEHFAGIKVPLKPVCPNHNAPFDYVCKAYFEPASDLVVWAPRGGGKTRLASALTMADMLTKPGCSIRVLGGSLEQSFKLWEHLLPTMEHTVGGRIVPRAGGSRRLELDNGSVAAVLTQSERAVRGLRVQKLRCDEVEMFEPHIWQAAQLVTRSENKIAGAIEAISTFHTPGGMMSRILDTAKTRKTPVLHWCLLEVLEKCPTKRDCNTCPLWDDCKGIAKTKCNGFFPIDDAIAMKQRVSLETWEAEMLCRRPVVHGCVFPHFDAAVHVRESVPTDGGIVTLAIDFGFHNPFVCLWVQDDGSAVHVIDEYVQEQRTIAEHVQQIESRAWGAVKRVACDPSGAGRNDQTAESNVQFLRRQGYKVHTKQSLIIQGLELIRAGLRPAIGSPTLFIHPRCKRLVAALKSLRYPKGGGELPLKDGTHDHPIDALRYFYVNRLKEAPQPPRRY